jgi:hypothetical protein
LLTQQWEIDEVLIQWKTMLPGLEPPGTEKIVQWIECYPESIIALGIRRGAEKANQRRDGEKQMTAFDVTRYASSVMRNAIERKQ